MTACSIITQGSAGHLITDTGWFLDDGRAAAFHSKVVALPELRVAIGIRGANVDLWSATARLAAPSQQYLLAALPELAQAVMANAQSQAPAMAGADDWRLGLYVVAWKSETRRAHGMYLGTGGVDIPASYVPWAYQPVQECLSPGVDLATLYCAEPNTADPRAFPIEANALTILEAQRAERWSLNGGPLAHRVGGAAELTTVDASGVRTRVLRTWADRVGERIAI